MNNKKLIKAIENLKVCIDEGHDFEFFEHYHRSGNPTIIEWKCKRCGYVKATRATEEQEHILMKYKTLKPSEKTK